VKAAFNRDDFRAAGHLARQFQGILVGFGARVDEEHRIQTEAAERCEFRGGALAYIQWHGIALEHELLRLLQQRLAPTRMTIAQRSDCMAAIQVQHLTAIGCVQIDAASAGDFQRKLCEHRRQMIVLCEIRRVTSLFVH
jgi:hypothetical protein